MATGVRESRRTECAFSLTPCPPTRARPDRPQEWVLRVQTSWIKGDGSCSLSHYFPLVDRRPRLLQHPSPDLSPSSCRAPRAPLRAPMAGTPWARCGCARVHRRGPLPKEARAAV